MSRAEEESPLPDDPLWYKTAIIYEVHVRAFADSNGDGIGDFPGLTSKLDYLKDLGVTALWLLPFYPSPLRDDGYDIASYTDVHPSYGTLDDFKTFLDEAHKRGLRVITELVLNHTSDQHPWFQRARRAPPGSKERDYYVWSESPEKYKGTRIIFQDFEHSNWSYDPVAKSYYWHRFYSHQPDLNFDAPHVKQAVFEVLDFWLDLGVDGVRLDAVPYLFEREGTNCENLPETHDVLRELRAQMDRRFKNRMLLAEANQWPEDAIAYFGKGDECHMAFHFPLMPRIFMATHMEDSFPIIEILQQTPPIPDNCQWALFLRNHDELTLEMVTDEERDYMYRVYARDQKMRINVGIRRRLAPLLSNNRRKIELLNGILFSMPGTPVLYYGDEVGMGDNFYLGDRNGVRTPMQWSSDRNGGFSRANPQQLYLPVIIDPEYHYEAINVEAQQNNPQSLLWWMRRLIALRKRYESFGTGTLEFLHPDNSKILAYLRRYGDQTVLVVANLSRFAQYAELDLSRFKGLVPLELFGRTRFPAVGDTPYFMPLGPHEFFWFLLEAPREQASLQPATPTLQARAQWDSIFADESRDALERALDPYVRTRRWFGGKARPVNHVKLEGTVPLSTLDGSVRLAMVRVEYDEGDPDTYMLPLGYAEGDEATRLMEEHPAAAVADLRRRGSDHVGILYDAIYSRSLQQTLLSMVAHQEKAASPAGTLRGAASPTIRLLHDPSVAAPDSNVLKADQSNTAVVFGHDFFMKVYRRMDAGVNPDLEIGRFLTEHTTFTNIAPVLGSVEFRATNGTTATIASLTAYTVNQGDAWNYTLEHIGSFLERALARRDDLKRYPSVDNPYADLKAPSSDQLLIDLIGPYAPQAQLLGRRTAEMHLALASNKEDPHFAPEAFSALYQRSIYQSMRNTATRALQLLRRRMKELPEDLKQDATTLFDVEQTLMGRFHALLGKPMEAMRIRVHGDYHLGQVLFTGKDFVIIDFEGEPARALSERRIKRSPLRDVAGMLRSFNYAAHAAFLKQTRRGVLPESTEDVEQSWTNLWFQQVAAHFLTSYTQVSAAAGLSPQDPHEFWVLLNCLTLEKAFYELTYELNNRPDWVKIPLRGILQLLESPA